MSTEVATKINKLLRLQPTRIVMQAYWLTKEGYSLNVQKRYKK